MVKSRINSILFILLLIQGTYLITAENIKINDLTTINIESIFRSYYINDQRIQWSGQEATFGAEAVLGAIIQKDFKWGKVKITTEVFVNQPFNQNILKDEYRVKYKQNFQINPLEIAQLHIKIIKGNFSFAMGKHQTIFGKDYSIPLSNSYFDQPFIRTEAILRYETGLFLKYTPGIFQLDIGVVNGCEEKDTNSSKAGLFRIGLKGKNWALGISGKIQDGIGSEQQKHYNNHAGIDMMFKMGSFKLSSEIIYDEYGFHREYREEDIFWKRSFYYRDIHYKYKTPASGIGGYINIQFKKNKWLFNVNYGQYYPKKIGNPYHDESTKRIILKIKTQFVTNLDFFAVVLFENKHPRESVFDGARDYAFMLGLQYNLL